MNNLQEGSSKMIQSNEEPSVIQLTDIIHIIKKNWYWFIISVVLSLCLAFFYIQKKAKIYERKALVLVDDRSGVSSSLSEVMQMSGISTGTNAQKMLGNELVIFKTTRLVSRVVDELNLRVSYTDCAKFSKPSLYKKTPFKMDVSHLDDKFSGSMQVKMQEDGSLKLSELKGDFEKFFANKKSLVVQLGESILTPLGYFKFIPQQTIEENISHTEAFIEVSSKENKVKGIKAVLQASVKKGNSIIELTYRDRSIYLAEDVLNTLVEKHEEIAKEDRMLIAKATERLINSRIKVISKELGNVDTKIESFKKENNIADISKETDLYVQGSSLLTKKMIELANQIELVKALREYLVEIKDSEDLIPANVGLVDNSATGLINEYNKLVLRREQLISESSSENPVVTSLKGQISSMYKVIRKTIDNLALSLNMQMKSLEKQEASTKSKISSVPSQEKLIGSIYRSQKIKEGLYLLLLNARETNALKLESMSTDLRIIEYATGSTSPVAPKKLFILIGAFLLGLIIPSAVLYIRILTNNMVRGRKDLEVFTSVPILGDIPHSRRSKKKKRKLIIGEKNRRLAKMDERRNQILNFDESERDVLSEAFSVLRTNMFFMIPPEKTSHVIMVTSPIPGEGKTFVSSNFGMSLARLNGKKVVVLDIDIRKGSLTDALRPELMSMTQGLTSFLTGSINTLEELVIPANNRILFDYIPAGVVPPNPSELLSTARFDSLIEMLKEKYDYIIMDTAPFCLVADAQVISRVSDLTVMVVREGHLPRLLLNNVESAYKSCHFPNMALVLNDAGVLDSVSGYGYGYYSYTKYGVYGEE